MEPTEGGVGVMNLVGDIMFDKSFVEEKDGSPFLEELEVLMIAYGIEKIDVGWSRTQLLRRQ